MAGQLEGLLSSEAGVIFGGHGMSKDAITRNLATLNVLWDAAPLQVDRRGAPPFVLHGARLTIALQVQEPTLRDFFAKSGDLARGTGFLARFLLSWPESTQG
jgi:putative DNA primase/helicase